jgi:hypothetical protein
VSRRDEGGRPRGVRAFRPRTTWSVDAVAIIGAVPSREVRAVLHQTPEGWVGRVAGVKDEVRTTTREGSIGALRRMAGPDATLTVEVTPALVGVSEAAAILGWDRRRVITYVDRGSFPEPVEHLASGRVWQRDQIEAFARAFARRQARRRRRATAS